MEYATTEEAFEAVQAALRAQLEKPESRPAGSTVHVGAEVPIERVLYRIASGPMVSMDDFTANLTKCLPMRGAELQEPLVWAGLSMFDTVEEASRTARRFNGRIGRYLAELGLPGDRDPRVRFVRPCTRPLHSSMLCRHLRLVCS